MTFNISPYIQAPWNTTEFLIDYSGNWTGRYTAIRSEAYDGLRVIAPEMPRRVLVVKHSQRDATEFADITADELVALGQAVLTIHGN